MEMPPLSCYNVFNNLRQENGLEMMEGAWKEMEMRITS